MILRIHLQLHMTGGFHIQTLRYEVRHRVFRYKGDENSDLLINVLAADQYFSRLKTYIETAHKISGKKVVLTSHSMGSQVAFFFMKWVEAEGYGNGGNAWVDTHIEAFINVSSRSLLLRPYRNLTL